MKRDTIGQMKNEKPMREILKAYLECAIWSSINFDVEDERYIDDDFCITDFSKNAANEAEIDINTFLKLIEGVEHGLSDSQLGHDFWLTRNRHGAGFFDRGIGEAGNQLTTIAQDFGERHVLVYRNRLVFSF